MVGPSTSVDVSSADYNIEKARIPLVRSNPAEYRRRVAAVYSSSVAVILGNVLEWYDWTVYGYMENLISELFMDGNSTATWLVFGVSFVARPIGSLVLGWVGDTCGRAVSLMISIWGMALATVLTGCLFPGMPGALTMLISLRLLSGISAGGEAAGVNTYMSEFGGQEKDQTIVAAVGVNNVSGALAFFLANLVSLSVHRFPKDMQLAWAWRIPFLLAAPLALVSIYLRRQMKETEEFEVAHRQVDEESDSDSKNGDRAVAESHSAAKEAIATFGFVRGIILCVIVQGASASWNYFPVYLSSWLSKNAGFSPTAALMMTGTSKIVQLLMTFPCSAFGDGFGATASMILGNILAAIFTLPTFFILIHTCGASADMAADAEHHTGANIVAFLVVGVLLPIFSSFFVVPGMLFVNSLFPTSVRARGGGFGYGLAAVVGGFTPMICDSLAEQRSWYPALLITCLTIPSLAALVWCRSAHARGALLVYQRPWLF